MENSPWYIVKRPTEHCDIVSQTQLLQEDPQQIQQQWGPYESQGDAMAKRVGLIRAGKCQPR